LPAPCGHFDLIHTMYKTEKPVLYSFRRCPYAIRARYALHVAKVEVEHREIDLKNKAPSLLAISPKATVPVLQLNDGQVIDESLEIMHWALKQADPESWLLATDTPRHTECQMLIHNNDNTFKSWLDRYKYAVGYPERSQTDYRQEAEKTLIELEARLKQSTWLIGETYSLADAAIMPFIRQFAFVDRKWFDQADYPGLRHWLDTQLQSDRFSQVMQKHPVFSI